MFFCPTCGGDRGYERRAAPGKLRVRRRGAGSGPEVILCSRCGTTHSPLSLLEPTNATIEEAVGLALRHGVVAVLRAGLRPVPDARALAAVTLVRHLGAPGVTEAAVLAGVRSIDDRALHAACARAGRVLRAEGRRRVLHACASVAWLDGPPGEGERLAVRRIGAGLGCLPEEVDAALRRQA